VIKKLNGKSSRNKSVLVKILTNPKTNNMKIRILILVMVIAFALNSNAQLKIYSTGNVGINATNPVSLFTVGGDGFAESKSVFHNTNTANNQRALRVYQAKPSSTYTYGLFSAIEAGGTSGVSTGILASGYRGSTAYTTGQTVGVRGQAGNASSGWNFSVWGELLGSNNGAAILGTIPGKGSINVSGIYAGYFRGNVKMENDLNVLGVFTNSDINLKKDVVNLDSKNIDKIKQLQAIKYKLKTQFELGVFSKEITDTAKATIIDAELNDPVYTRDYIGISAQDIQKVFPEIVKVEDNGYLSVNYIELIPILMEAIKEQQVTIDDLKKKVDALTAGKKQ
jgi:hypothetical protein